MTDNSPSNQHQFSLTTLFEGIFACCFQAALVRIAGLASILFFPTILLCCLNRRAFLGSYPFGPNFVAVLLGAVLILFEFNVEGAEKLLLLTVLMTCSAVMMILWLSVRDREYLGGRGIAAAICAAASAIYGLLWWKWSFERTNDGSLPIASAVLLAIGVGNLLAIQQSLAGKFQDVILRKRIRTAAGISLVIALSFGAVATVRYSQQASSLRALGNGTPVFAAWDNWQVITISLDGADLQRLQMQQLSEFPKLATLYLEKTSGTGEQMKHVANVPSLETLSLAKSGLTDEGLRFIRPLSQLRAIDLRDTMTGDAGMDDLACLPDLEHVVLQNTDVTDAGLVKLKANQRLRHVYLQISAEDRGTRVTTAGADLLRKNLLKVQIHGK